jgi:SAM-dependent methyltransferase
MGYNSSVVRPSTGSSRSEQRPERRAPQELADATPGAYWDGILRDVQRSSTLDAWRVYMRRVYGRLLAAWMSTSAASGPALKTDLFEEAVSCHSVLGDLGRGSIGVDCSPDIVHAAHRRLGPEYRMVVGDLRHLPLRSESIARILAGSSLDHFSDKRDIAVALAELARVLQKGGTLVITFDNPLNPAVRLRNRLPFAWLYRLKLVPYYVGATYDHIEATRELERLGFRVTATGAVAHAPRLPAVWLAAAVGRLHRPVLCSLIAGALERFEILGRLPTRYRTGYYVALRAVKVAG